MTATHGVLRVACCARDASTDCCVLCADYDVTSTIVAYDARITARAVMRASCRLLATHCHA